MSNQTVKPTYRLASLDILRGFDLFLLVFLQPVLWAVLSKIDAPWAQAVLYHFDHEVWNGFRVWDLVMPLFLFMCGASMPFSFSKLMREHPVSFIYKKVVRRFLILFLLGMVIQGNLLGFDWDHIYIYTNTLQAIGTGYLFTALMLLHFSFRKQILAGVVLLVIYSVPFMLTGDYSPEGNFANRVDQAILGRFRGDPTYTWIWSSLTFTVTVLMGAIAGRIMKDGKEHQEKVVSALFLIGAVLVAGAILWELALNIPVNKRIWTSTMTLLSGGYCFFLMALFYYWIDYRGHVRGLQWLKFYGMNSIVAYVLGEFINFRSIAHSVSYGLEPYLGEFYPAWLSFVNFAILFLILQQMYKHKIFVKI